MDLDNRQLVYNSVCTILIDNSVHSRMVVLHLIYILREYQMQVYLIN